MHGNSNGSYIGVAVALAVFVTLFAMAVFVIVVATVQNDLTPLQKTTPIATRVAPTARVAWSGAIPLVIYQTHARNDVPLGMAYAIQTIRAANPEFTHVYMDDAAVLAFMKKHTSPRVQAAYATLLPGAFKADLFRYCVLYTFGGVYLDTGMCARKRLLDVLRPDHTFLSCADCNIKSILQAFLCTSRGNRILEAAIALCVERIETKNAGATMLSLTGPELLGEVFRKVTGANFTTAYNYGNGVELLRSRLFGIRCIPSKVISHDGSVLFHTKYPGYYSDASWYPQRGTKHYSAMWAAKELFKTI